MNKYKIYAIVFLVSLSVTLGVSIGTWFFDNNISRNLDKDIIINNLKEIKKLEVLEAEIFAYNTFEEKSYIPFNKSAIAITLSSKAIYGIDLSNDVDITIENKKAIIRLPNIKLLHLNLNPNNIKVIFAKKSLFLTQNEFEDLKEKYISNLYLDTKRKANNDIYISQAEKSSKNFISSLFLAFGFEEVEISFKKNM